MPFTSHFVAKQVTARLWRVHEPLQYEGAREDFTVPVGFTTDFASVPRLLWAIIPPTGKYTKAAVMHDWFYREKFLSRKDADGLFRRMMKESGVPWWRRQAMYRAVRMFGWIPWRRK